MFQFKGSKPLRKPCYYGLLPLQLMFKPTTPSWEPFSQSQANLSLTVTSWVRGNTGNANLMQGNANRY